MQLDFRKFRYFSMIAQERSISKAAQKLYISQPSLSKFLTQLEDELSVPLFDRSTTPLTLTQAGIKYAEFVLQASNLFEHYMREIREVDQPHQGEIHVGFGPWRGSFIVTNVFPKVQSEYPNLHIVIHEECNDYLRQLLAKKQIDVAITSHTLVDKFEILAPSSEIMMRDRILIVAAKEHPLSSMVDFQKNSLFSPQLIDIRLLANRRLITGKPGQKINNDFRSLVNKYSLSPIEAIETININTAIELAANNFGIAFVPASYLISSPSIDKLIFFYSEDPLLTWLIIAEYNTAHPSRLEHRFVEFVKDAYSAMLKNDMMK